MSFGFLRELLYRAAGTLGRRRMDRDLDEEVRAHLRLLEDRFRRQGLAPDEARKAARREFGGVGRLREAHRMERSLVGPENLARDFAYAMRGLLGHPGFALTAVVSLALAVGANSAIFSFADGLLLRPLPVPAPSSIVSLRPISPSLRPGALVGGDSISYPDFVDFRASMTSFEDLTIFNDIGVGFAPESGGRTRRIAGYLVSGNFFRVLDVDLPIGRDFLPEEDQVPERDAVIILSHALWLSELAGDPDVVGRSVRIDGLQFTVIGVAPETFTGPEPFIRPDFFAPVTMGPAIGRAAGEDSAAQRMLTDREFRAFRAKGRLRAGVSRAAASDEASIVARSLALDWPDTNRGWDATVSTEVQLRLARFPLIGLLLSAVFTVVIVNLLVACANVASLMLTRGRTRSREIAIRLAIGAGRGRIIRLLLAESLWIALASGGLALVLANFAVGVFSRIELDPDVSVSFQMDTRLVAFTILVSIASALLFGLVPALRATRTDLVSAIKMGESGFARRRFWGRNSLAVVQIAGSMVLLMGAAGFRALFDDALTQYPGFERERRITMRFDPALAGYDPARVDRFYGDLVDRAKELPGIRSATLSSNVPLSWFDIGVDTVIPEGNVLPEDRESIDVLDLVVDGHYFESFGVPILEGRSFGSLDTALTTPVAIVNEAFASRYLGQDPLGSRVQLHGGEGPTVEVVGVTVTGKALSVIEPPVETIYLPLSQNPRTRLTLIAETEGDPAGMAAPLQDMIRERDPEVPVYRVQTMEEVFEGGSVSMLRVVGATYDAAALMGLALALIGLYAVLAFQVGRRTQEIGVRMALGSEPGEVMRMFLGRAALMALAGVAMGTALSLVAGAAVAREVGGMSFDPVPIAVVAIALLATTLLASAIPARRAARIDPQLALRQE